VRSKNSPSTDHWIWGLHSVLGALENCPEMLLEIQVENSVNDAPVHAKGATQKNRDLPDTEEGNNPHVLGQILALCNENSLKVKSVVQLPKALNEKRTQGVVAKLKKFPDRWWNDYADDLVNFLDDPEAKKHFVILDEIQDPRNFGAILRSAAAFGVEAVFIRDRKQAPLNGVVAQASAGNIFRVSIIQCGNFNGVLEAFSKRDLPIWGLEASSEKLSDTVKEEKANALLWILGGEATGIRPVLREKCTKLLSIPMSEGVESLNASVAASIAFYESSKHFNL